MVKTLKVVATGGLGRIIYNETDMIDIYDPDLAFKGMKVIYHKTKGIRRLLIVDKNGIKCIWFFFLCSGKIKGKLWICY